MQKPRRCDNLELSIFQLPVDLGRGLDTPPSLFSPEPSACVTCRARAGTGSPPSLFSPEPTACIICRARAGTRFPAPYYLLNLQPVLPVELGRGLDAPPYSLLNLQPVLPVELGRGLDAPPSLFSPEPPL